MTKVSISFLKKYFADLISDVIKKDDPILANTKDGNVVIISETKYNAILETIYLISQKRFIKEGENESISSMATYNPNKKW